MSELSVQVYGPSYRLGQQFDQLTEFNLVRSCLVSYVQGDYFNKRNSSKSVYDSIKQHSTIKLAMNLMEKVGNSIYGIHTKFELFTL